MISQKGKIETHRSVTGNRKTRREDNRENEKRVVVEMIALYCEKKHKHSEKAKVRVEIPQKGKRGPTSLLLCEDCANLLAYSMTRLDNCPHGERKKFCSHCSTPCYSPSAKERIRKVMRFSGPHLLYRNPWILLRHFFDSLNRKRTSDRR